MTVLWTDFPRASRPSEDYYFEIFLILFLKCIKKVHLFRLSLAIVRDGVICRVCQTWALGANHRSNQRSFIFQIGLRPFLVVIPPC